MAEGRAFEAAAVICPTVTRELGSACALRADTGRDRET
jgi:hypothetical protein